MSYVLFDLNDETVAQFTRDGGREPLPRKMVVRNENVSECVCACVRVCVCPCSVYAIRIR